MLNCTCVLITKDKTYPKEVLDSLPEFEELIIETECPSLHRRYELAKKARNETIYVQDDDCVIDVLRLYNRYNGTITNAMKPEHFRGYAGTGVTLVGWGCFFPKKMIDFTRYLAKYPVDDLFLSQTDRVFTYLNQPHNSIIMPIRDLPSASDDTRMSTSPGHWQNLHLIKQRLLTIK